MDKVTILIIFHLNKGTQNNYLQKIQLLGPESGSDIPVIQTILSLKLILFL